MLDFSTQGVARQGSFSLLTLTLPPVHASPPQPTAPPLIASQGMKTFDVYPAAFAAIGRLKIQSQDLTYYCSATLIRKNLLVTARHCVVDTANQYYPSVRFQPGYFNDAKYPEVEATPVAAGKTDTTPDDWALLHLKAPLEIPPMPISFPNPDKKVILNPAQVMTVGYAFNMGGGATPSFDTQCFSELSLMERIYTLCQFDHGFSGGPFLLFIKGRWFLVGILSSMYDRPVAPDAPPPKEIYERPNLATPIYKIQKALGSLGV